MKLTALFKDFFASEKAGGLILLAATIFSLILSNTAWGAGYIHLWHINAGGLSVTHWINDGLMAIFFLLIGLELEREIYLGELSDIKNAALPVAGAIGGMIVPGLLFFIFNFNTTTSSGIGVPTATDIAFALGILSLLGKKVPASLKIFLTALAVTDDLGAILIIAIFYSKGIILLNLGISLAVWILLLVLKKLKVKNLIPYLAGGIVMWYFMHYSGVHATITGVLLAFAIPFDKGDEKSPSYMLQHWLHKPVAFFILPVFALANTALVITAGWQSNFLLPHSKGIIAGLLVGKPLGISLFCFTASALGWCRLPDDIGWKQIIGAGFLGGIGFTMSIFITLLAFDDEAIINSAKLMILVASFASGTIGFLLLKQTLKKDIAED